MEVVPYTQSQFILFEKGIVKVFNWDDLTQSTMADRRSSQTTRAVIASSGCAHDEIPSYADADAVSITSEDNNLVFAQTVQPSCGP